MEFVGCEVKTRQVYRVNVQRVEVGCKGSPLVYWGDSGCRVSVHMTPLVCKRKVMPWWRNGSRMEVKPRTSVFILFGSAKLRGIRPSGERKPISYCTMAALALEAMTPW